MQTTWRRIIKDQACVPISNLGMLICSGIHVDVWRTWVCMTDSFWQLIYFKKKCPTISIHIQSCRPMDLEKKTLSLYGRLPGDCCLLVLTAVMQGWGPCWFNPGTFPSAPSDVTNSLIMSEGAGSLCYITPIEAELFFFGSVGQRDGRWIGHHGTLFFSF